MSNEYVKEHLKSFKTKKSAGISALSQELSDSLMNQFIYPGTQALDFCLSALDPI